MIADVNTDARPLPLPLEGIRVLDATHIVAGPFCSLILADMGAEVIKIERPRTGDVARGRHPMISDAEGNLISSRFLGVNRNKKSVSIDLRNPRCKLAFEELVRGSDVLVDNWGSGAFRRLGLGYDHLSEINPGLVYASITGYGDSPGLSGPYSDWPANNLAIQAMAGWMELTGEPRRPSPERRRQHRRLGTRTMGRRWASCWPWRPAAGPDGGNTWTWRCTSAWCRTSRAT